MAGPRTMLACLTVLTGVLATTAGPVAAQEKYEHWSSRRLPIDEMPAGVRDRVRSVVDSPTMYTHGPTEEFTCRPALYYWLLDHPDRAIQAWRKLGARCVDITDLGN